MGILKICFHGGVLGKEVMFDLMNDELGVAEYLKLFSFHLFGFIICHVVGGVEVEVNGVFQDHIVYEGKD